MNRVAHEVTQRLSLRTPQREALHLLSAVAEALPMQKGADPAAALAAVQALCPTVTDFERAFPSLCFALATGVGKTRLMGAFIAYLHRAKGVRNFFVLAPNLTIYEKLKHDFDPAHEKYVFQGIGEFARQRPVVITGENYESHRSIARFSAASRQVGLGFEEVHISIFNIGKLNAETRGDKAPRMKKLSEVLGVSYFQYLMEQPDLVLLMDESHRYRAERGMAVLNELNPMLGIELTATPFVEHPRGPIPFKNIAYSYPLSAAIRDGYVKQPVALTRENFQHKNFTAEELERVKLEDGLRVHEMLKVELEIYTREKGIARVKPFMLVVAQDTTHADALQQTLTSESFFGGRYAGKVIRVDSKLRGEEGDEVVQRLLRVEDPAEPTEVVIHVNMLKEGWDVRNLYVIVPLRAANARQLVEQTVGRGLRLPFGTLTGRSALDRLTIVAHDRFDELIAEAGKPDSLIRGGVMVGRDIPAEGVKLVVAPPSFVHDLAVLGTLDAEGLATAAETGALPASPAPQQLPLTGGSGVPVAPVQAKHAELMRKVGEAVAQAGSRPERFPLLESLTTPEGLKHLTRAVVAQTHGTQLPTAAEEAELATMVGLAAKAIVRRVIGIPQVKVLPDGEVTCGYHDFDLDLSAVHYASVDEAMLLQHLQDQSKVERIALEDSAWQESTLEREILNRLLEANDVSWELHKTLLRKLVKQMADHIRALHPDDAMAMRVARYHMAQMQKLMLTQMRAHFWTRPERYVTRFDGGFRYPKEAQYSTPEAASARDFNDFVEDKQDIRSLVFGGFRRCVYPLQKFDSDTERRFAVLLEHDAQVEKWMKPARGLFTIRYDAAHEYEPDFVVETATGKLLVEVKRRDMLHDAKVQAKAAAGRAWCEKATEYEQAQGGKAWRYALIADDLVKGNMTLAHLVALSGSDGEGGVG